MAARQCHYTRSTLYLSQAADAVRDERAASVQPAVWLAAGVVGSIRGPVSRFDEPLKFGRFNAPFALTGKFHAAQFPVAQVLQYL